MKEISRQILFLFLLCSTVSSSFGQSNSFRNGYVVLLNQDTLSGLIKDIGRQASCDQVIFKKTEQEESINYSPAAISAYFIEGIGHYQSARIQLRGDDIFRDKFLKKLVAGRLELFRLDDQLLEDTAPFLSYENVFYFIKFKNKKKPLILYRINYREKTPAYVNACPQVDQQLKGHRYKFDNAGLIRMTVDYNECLGTEAEVLYRARKGRKLYYTIGLGGLHAKIEPGHPLFEGYQLSTGNGFEIRALVDIPLKGGLMLRGGLSFTQKKTTGQQEVIVNEFYINEGAVLQLNSGMTFRHLSVPIQLKYQFLSGPAQAYLAFGGGFGVALNNQLYVEDTKFINEPMGSTLITSPAEPYSIAIAAYDLSLRGSIGLDYDFERIGLFAEAQWMSSHSEFNSDSNNFFKSSGFSWLLGLRF